MQYKDEMKVLLIFFLAVLLLTSCDYESILNIQNQNNEAIQINVKGNPIKEYGGLKLIIESGDNFSYQLEKESEHNLIQLVNEHIKPSNIPFENLEIITEIDTIRFNSKDEIFEAMIKQSEDYYLIIVD